MNDKTKEQNEQEHKGKVKALFLFAILAGLTTGTYLMGYMKEKGCSNDFGDLVSTIKAGGDVSKFCKG